MENLVFPTYSDDWNRWSQRLAKLVAQTWFDEELRQEFINRPKKVLKENGLIVPEGVNVRVEVGGTVWRIVGEGFSVTTRYVIPLPDRPDNINVEELEALLATENFLPSLALPACAFFMEAE